MNKENYKNKIVKFINDYDKNFYLLNSKFILEELDYKIYSKKWKLNSSLINYVKRYVSIRKFLYDKYNLQNITQLNNVVNIYRYYDYVINQLYGNDKNKLNKFMNLPLDVIFKGYKFNVSNNSIVSIGNPRFIKQLKEYTLDYISRSHNDYYNLDENYNVKMYGGKKNNPDDHFEYYHFIDFNYGYNNTNIPKIEFTDDKITINKTEKNINISSLPEDDKALLTLEIKNEISNNSLFYNYDLSLIDDILTTGPAPAATPSAPSAPPPSDNKSEKLMNFYKLIKIAQNFTLLKDKLVDKYIQAIQDDLGKSEASAEDPAAVPSAAVPSAAESKIEDFVNKYKDKMKVLSYYSDDEPTLIKTINEKLNQLVNVFRAYNYCYSVLQKDKKNPDYNLEETQEAPEFDDRWINFEYQPTNLYYETEFVGGADFDEIFNIQQNEQRGGEWKEKPEDFEISMFNDLEITDSLINFILEGYNIDIVNFTVGQPNFINYMRSLTQFYFEPIGDEIPDQTDKYYSYRTLLKPMDIINYYFKNQIHELKEAQTNEDYKYDDYTYDGKDEHKNIQYQIISNILKPSIQETREGGNNKIYGGDGEIDTLAKFKKLIKRVYNIDDTVIIIKKGQLHDYYIKLLSTEKEKLILDPITILMFNNNVLTEKDIETIFGNITITDDNKSKVIYMIKQLNDWNVVQKYCDKINKLKPNSIKSDGEDEQHKYTKSICGDKDKCNKYYEHYPID